MDMEQQEQLNCTEEVGMPAEEPANLPEQPETENAGKEKSSLAQEFYFTLSSLATVLVALVLTFTFVGRLILVSGDSMVPTLLDGELLIVRSIAYEPKQGDIVILAEEGFHGGEAIVKRVIATGGQTVFIDYTTGTVYVDDVALDEPYIKELMYQQFYQSITYMEVPEGHIFVMGDNRNDSDDSRNPTLGVVDERRVLGEAILVIFPFREFKIL